MPLFTDAAVNTLYRSTVDKGPNLSEQEATMGKKAKNATTKKNELAKKLTPGDIMVLRVTLLITKEGHYIDAPEDDTETALMGLLDTISNLEESLALAGKSEWMEAWDSDYPRLNIDGTINLEDETLLNYFQKGNEKVGKTKKEVWRFAIQGSTSPDSLVRCSFFD